MIEDARLKQIRDVLRLTGQDDSLIDKSMDLISGQGDFLGLLYKVRESLDRSIKLIEENQRKNDL